MRILIADDHPLVRQGLRTVLESDEEMEVVGEAATGTQAVELAGALAPDIVVIDLQMPQLNGIDATRQILAKAPAVGVLVLTMFDDDASVFTAMKVGTRGYLLKGAERDEILRAVRSVASGEAIFGTADHATDDRLLRRIVGGHAGDVPTVRATASERCFVSSPGIERSGYRPALTVSGKTVSNHVSVSFSPSCRFQIRRRRS